MSGFAVLVGEFATPPELIDGVRGTLLLRDPVGEGRWKGRGITLMHTRIAIGANSVAPPMEVAGQVVLFDGRLDGRAELVRELRAVGRQGTTASDDAELVAQAFAAWEERAPEHLIGEFSFVVWNGRTRAVTCVRDRFGVRPLYHAQVGSTRLITNDFATLLAVEGLADELYEPAIADFLLFGGNQDLSRTTYASIRRVPPAHAMVINPSGDLTVQRYWSLPVEASPRRIPPADAVEEFAACFRTAVSDRTFSGSVAISLSGGLDSNAVAAAAVASQATVHAVTAGYERMFVDEEPSYAQGAAEALGISWEFLPADRYALFERWSDPYCRGLEPTDTPMRAAFVDLMARLAAHDRVLLTGQGGDSVLYTSHGYFVKMLRQGLLLPAVLQAASYAITRRRRPPLLIRSHALRALGLRSDQPAFPSWIREDFAHAHALRARWAEFWSWRSRSLHPWRPEAAVFATQPMWPNAFETYDFAWTGSRLELSVPFLDVRLVEFLFTLPAMPHFADKDILRQAMKGQIPESVRTRMKAPLAGDPVSLLLRDADPQRLLAQLPRIERFVDPRILQASIDRRRLRGQNFDEDVAPLCLAEWISFR